MFNLHRAEKFYPDEMRDAASRAVVIHDVRSVIPALTDPRSFIHSGHVARSRARARSRVFMRDSKPQITPTRKLVKARLRLRSLSAR